MYPKEELFKRVEKLIVDKHCQMREHNFFEKSIASMICSKKVHSTLSWFFVNQFLYHIGPYLPDIFFVLVDETSYSINVFLEIQLSKIKAA